MAYRVKILPKGSKVTKPVMTGMASMAIIAPIDARLLAAAIITLDRARAAMMATTTTLMPVAMIALRRAVVMVSDAPISMRDKRVLKLVMMAMKTTAMAASAIAKWRVAAMVMSSAVKRLVTMAIKSKLMVV